MFRQCLFIIVAMAMSLVVSGCAPTIEQTETSAISASTATPVLVPATAPTSTNTPRPIPAEPADVIFHNGTIITIEESMPLAEAIALRNGLIQAVGTSEDILALQGPDAVVIDLKGSTMMPGFIEGHTHFILSSLQDGKPLEETMNTLLGFGLTSVSEMNVDLGFIEAMLAAEQNDQLRVRVNLFPNYNATFLDNGKTIIDRTWYLDHEPILDPTRMLRIPGVKIFADGSGESGRGCAYKTFTFPENITEVWPNVWDVCGTKYGDLYLTEAQLTEALRSIQERSYRASFHATGDATIDAILNALETVLGGESNDIYRHQIQHSTLMRQDQIKRYEDLDIIATVQIGMSICGADEYKAIFGEGHYEWLGNRYDLPKADIHTYAIGDFGRQDPFDLSLPFPLNPIMNLYGLVTHRQLHSDGSFCSPPEWISRHAISVERTLEMLTIEPAYAVSMEDYIGSLKPSKYADLIILSDNPLTMDSGELYELKVWMTMVGGKVEYCTIGHEGICP